MSGLNKLNINAISKGELTAGVPDKSITLVFEFYFFYFCI